METISHVCTEYYESGKLMVEMIYKNGERISEKYR
jgi:antitoxin component YwqK of YwqJK toxin-antitoxin module